MSKKINSKHALIRDSLRAKKSTRTTFKLSPASVTALAHISKTEKVTLKEIFNLLRSLILTDDDGNFATDRVQELKDSDLNHLTQRKTYVVSQEFLDDLNEFCSEQGVSRDLVIDRAINFYVVVWHSEEQRQRKLREKALPLLEELELKIKNTLKEVEEILGPNDEVLYYLHEELKLSEEITGELGTQLAEGNPLGNLKFVIEDE